MLTYKVKFYKDSQNGKEPVLEYIEKLDNKNKAKNIKVRRFFKRARRTPG